MKTTIGTYRMSNALSRCALGGIETGAVSSESLTPMALANSSPGWEPATTLGATIKTILNAESV